MTDDVLVAALEPVARALESCGVRYFLGGSVASSVHGIARASIDADVVADLEVDHLGCVVPALAGRYYVPVGLLEPAVRNRSSFNLIHLETAFKVDIFVAKGRPYDKTAAARARPATVGLRPGSASFPVASPEDVILAKLEWFRKGGEVSERQWWDIIGVLKVRPDLDRAYLRQWSTALGVRDLLDRAEQAALRAQ